MTAFIWSRPTARKRHRCQTCRRVILPGEDYDRMFGVDGDVWTYKCCRHCYRVARAWEAWSTEYEWDEFCISEFLHDEHPALYASRIAGWRFPDGELMSLPFQSRCNDCRTTITDDRIWCQACDVKRIERIAEGFRQIEADFGAAS